MSQLVNTYIKDLAEDYTNSIIFTGNLQKKPEMYPIIAEFPYLENNVNQSAK